VVYATRDADVLESIGGALCVSVGTRVRQPSTWIQVETGWTASPRSRNESRLTHIRTVEYLHGQEGGVLEKVGY
jgi:hypothetical protein